nr:MAG TPA: hypothetical protein [Caudoviricetes sp.]
MSLAFTVGKLALVICGHLTESRQRCLSLTDRRRTKNIQQ